MEGRNEFDIKAEDWDKNPMHWERSYAIAGEILKQIPLKPEFRALEFGAGTGILSFLLRKNLKEILLMDSSHEMIRIINEKIAVTGVLNMKTVFFDLEHSDYKKGKFDLIFSQMVLHHVADIDNIISKFRNLINPGGYLVIADLYPEDGSFHGKGFTGHKGFDPEELSGTILKKGFLKVTFSECFVINRKESENITKHYPVFLLLAINN